MTHHAAGGAAPGGIRQDCRPGVLSDAAPGITTTTTRTPEVPTMKTNVIADRLDARAHAAATPPRGGARRGSCPTLADIRRAGRMARRARRIREVRP